MKHFKTSLNFGIDINLLFKIDVLILLLSLKERFRLEKTE